MPVVTRLRSRSRRWSTGSRGGDDLVGVAPEGGQIGGGVADRVGRVGEGVGVVVGVAGRGGRPRRVGDLGEVGVVVVGEGLVSLPSPSQSVMVIGWSAAL